MATQLRFDGKVALITGGSGSLGAAYAHLFAARGAKVVINDMDQAKTNDLVNKIKKAGGEASGNFDNVVDGIKIIKHCIDTYGRIDIIINNAGILRDKSFKAMTDAEFNAVQVVHVKGAFAVTHAAWPLFRKQKYGRIINISSAAGIYGSFGQSNYSAAKSGLITFARTLAREGVKYNINANTIAPLAASPMLATVMPPDFLEKLKPEHIAPIVGYLCHESCKESGQLFEMGGGWYGKIRWEQTDGVIFRTDESFTPSAVQARWKDISDFSKNTLHPTSQNDRDLMGKVTVAQSGPANKQGKKIDYTDKVVLVTGGGAGIGRAYSLMYAKLGAKVAVNDFSAKNANAVVDEIKKAGGKAVAVVESVEKGESVIKSVIEAFGTVHVVVNNAGILRDKSFTAMTEKEWDEVYSIHLKGSYSVTKAAWPYMLKQKYGRVIMTSSIVGVHGNFGQANYGTAKAALIGLARTLALEGKKNNILVNCLVPTAGTAMTATVWTPEMLKIFDPGFVVPPVGYLTSDVNEDTGVLFEVSGGWVSRYRYQRTFGYGFPNSKIPTIEQIQDKWSVITRFDDKSTFPATTSDAAAQIMANFSEGSGNPDGDEESFDDPEDSELVKKMKSHKGEPTEHTWTQRDVLLYNLGVGASEKELKYTFEGDDNFQAIPTFAVIPTFAAGHTLPYDMLPNFSPMMLLHGEQYLSIKKPIPTEGTTITTAQFADIIDKGKAAAVTSTSRCVDKESGELLLEAYSTTFIRGAGGFGGKKNASDRGPVTALNKPPSRKPDFEFEFKTEDRQAAIYRLSGDYNPLHIDPAFAAIGGFKQPILHGLGFFGIAGKALYDKYGAFEDIKVRFAGHVFCGETVQIQAWKDGNKVIFIAKCKERGTTVLSNAAITLKS